MSKTLNMITAKRGGGVTASIKVLGDIASTDTCYASLGAKTKQGVWTTDEDGSYWLIKNIADYGTWTVHWSDGTRTNEKQVLIDVITEYTIEEIERTYLYKDGDECNDITGGWHSVGVSGAVGTITKKTTHMEFEKNNSMTAVSVQTINNIDLSEYAKIKYEFGVETNAESAQGFRIGVNTSNAVLWVAPYWKLIAERTVPRTIDEYNAITGSNLYPAFSFNIGSAYYGKIKVYKVWLE